MQTTDRPAMRTVEPMREPIFQRKLTREPVWKKSFDIVCDAYKNLKPDFSIVYDNFGGYRLLYVGNKIVHPPFIFKRNPIGFVREVPEGAVTNLSVMTSERTGKQLLLLWPMRFVNSDCSPNCEYDFSSQSDIVQLRVKRKLCPGDEVFVKYGTDFFEENACLCRKCELQAKDEASRSAQFQDIVDDLIFEVVAGIVVELNDQENAKQADAVITKRHRVKCRELVEVYNDLERSPLSSTDSPEKNVSTSISANFSCPNRALDYNGATEQSETEPNLSILFSDESESNLSLSSSDNEQSSEAKLSIVLARASSPLGQNALPSFSVSEILEENTLTLNSSTSIPDSLNLKLFEGSETTVKEATDLMDLFCAKFNLFDECSASLHSLVKVLLPTENRLPSGYSHVQSMKRNYEEKVRAIRKTSAASFCVLSFRFQIRDIVKSQLSNILRYSNQRKEDPFGDFSRSICPIVEVGGSENLLLNLILFSDGVNIKKSTFKKEIWPIWIQIADLPPKLRMARKNIVLAALFVGETVPDWTPIVPHLRSEIFSGIDLSIDEQTN